MAISFSRPDPASPASVSSAQFPTSRRGYDQSEVRDFLRMVAAEQARLQERERFLERELRAAQHASSLNVATIDEDTATRLLGEEAARVLTTAREAATQIRGRAEEGSARLLREATDEAQRLREEAEIEAARRRQDASADSEAELQMAKQQGRDMVNEARAYRERVLSELARRRELARQQIEQLIHGRDRLLQAFERSRIAAVEVMAELTPLGEPNEYVNLSPTTGPVPVMVPGKTQPPRLTDVSFVGETRGATDGSGEMVDDITDDADNTVVLSIVPNIGDESDDDVEVEAEVGAEAVEVDVEVVAIEIAVVQVASMDVSEQDELAVPEVFDADAAPGEVSDVWAAPAVGVDDGVAESAESVDPFDGGMELIDANDGNDVANDDAADVANDDAADVAESAPVPGGTVDDLFARLRASRSDTVARKVADHDTALQTVVDDSVPADGTADVTEIEVADVAEDAASDESADGVTAPDPEELIVPLIVSVARKLKRVLADEQNEVLDTLRRKEPVRAIDALVPWEAEQSDRYAEAVRNELMAASVAGAKGGDDGRNPAIVGPATDAVTNEIVAPLRERLTRCIDKAAGDNAELSSQVKSLYREWKTHRIDEHVEEIVRLAYDRGALTVATT